MAAEGAYWMNTYEPEWNYGPAFFDARHNFVFSANYELPFGKGRTWGSDASRGRRRDPRRLEAERHLPGAHRASRSPSPTAAHRSLQGQRGNERPNCIGDPVPSDQNIAHWLDINAFQRVPLGTWGNCGIGVARAPGYKNIDARAGQAVQRRRRTRYFEFRAEAFNLTNTPSFGPPGARHQRAEHVRHDHEHRQHGSDGRDGVEVLLLTADSGGSGVRYGLSSFRRTSEAFAV